MLKRYGWIVLFLAGVGLVGYGLLGTKPGRRPDTARQVTTAEGEQVDSRGVLGPASNDDADAYLKRKRSFLTAQSSKTPNKAAAALVSASRYLDAAEVTALAGAATVQALFVKGPSVVPVSGSVGLALGDKAGEKTVYGFVVSSTTLGELVKLASADGVRLVDVADPVAADLRGWELRPLELS